ncbi:hypothetical protein K439DRAFT_1610631 [Ramaria rubella]|nr:hypothetical protein K439DRAFT_1610631 [Ramaria rubella]
MGRQDLQDLKALVADFMDITIPELPTQPLQDQQSPIAGLEVHTLGRVCVICEEEGEQWPKASKGPKSVHIPIRQSHHPSLRKGRTIGQLMRVTPTQTFSHNSAKSFYFPVCGQVTPPTVAEVPKGMDLAKRLQDRTVSDLGGLTDHHPIDNRDILPFFESCSLLRHLEPHNNRKRLAVLVKLPNSRLASQIMQAVSHFYSWMVCDSTHFWMQWGTYHERGILDGRPLNPPLKLSSQKVYSLEPAKFILVVMDSLDREEGDEDDGDFNDPLQYYISLDNDQREKALLLRNHFKPCRTQTLDDEEWAARADELIHSFFFSCLAPSGNLSRLYENPFTNPFIQYLALRVLDKRSGGFIEIRAIPPLLSILQSLLRSVILQEITKRKPPVGSGGDVFDAWWLDAKDLCEKWLREGTVSPFATVRRWMHVTTKVVKGASRPSIISWLDKNTISIRSDHLRLDHWKSFLRSSMDDLTSFVNKEVLFETNLDSLGIHYPASHLPNNSASEERNSGYGIFAPQSGNIFTPGSAAFLNILHSKGFLILEGEASTITWCTEKALKWLPHITVALEKAFNLVHVLQGPAPRGTERGAY